VLLAVSKQSFWIDETLTGWKASAASLKAWWRAMVEERASDLQMPLYMIFMWAWEKLAGHGEWALRAINAVWFLPGLIAIDRATCRGLGWGTAVALLISPFAWYYLDEARPYAMQLGSALLVTASILRLRADFWSENSHPQENAQRDARRWTAILVTGAVLLAGSSLLGLIWLGAAGLLLLLLVKPKRLVSWLREHWAVLSLGGVCTVGLGIYYLWSLTVGARASAAASTDLRSALFVFYELLGFSGLGPGRTELRAHGLSAIRPYLIPLAVYGMLLAAIGTAGLRWIWREMSSRTRGITFGVLALFVGMLFALGVVTHFRVLGRHFTPLWPSLGLVIGAGFYSLWQSRRLGPRIVGAAFAAACLVSCLSFGFAERHRKDAYREAAGFARKAIEQRQSVWWNAEKSGADLYGLNVGTDPKSDTTAFIIINPTAGMIDSLPPPRYVLASKPDLYDGSEALVAYLSKNGYEQVSRLPGFVIWGKPF
jgi:hypothetical protein